ncbi:MAG TPA: phosphate-starvation-inducible PsiE family protein [Polyangiaceae bacterium]
MKKSWPSVGAYFLGRAESGVLILIGAVLVVLAVLMLGQSVVHLYHATQEGRVHEEAIEILDGVLLVMMTMEIVYTVAISLEAHALVAEPFLIIGAIAAIRRMLVITATSTKDEHAAPEVFRNTLYELALLSLIVITMAYAIVLLRKSAKYVPAPEGHGGDGEGHAEKPAAH